MCNIEDSVESIVFIPPAIKEQAASAILELIPTKSKVRYDKNYNSFEAWKKENKIIGLNEDILLAYFYHLEKSLKASSLWTRYSTLKSTLQTYQNVDISRLTLNSFLC